MERRAEREQLMCARKLFLGELDLAQSAATEQAVTVAEAAGFLGRLPGAILLVRIEPCSASWESISA